MRLREAGERPASKVTVLDVRFRWAEYRLLQVEVVSGRVAPAVIDFFVHVDER